MGISKETFALINTFKDPLIKFLTDIKDEVNFYFDTGIIQYVDSIRDKFLKTKTFLFRLEKVNFYDVYFPIPLSNKEDKEYYVNDIEDLFKNSNYISIIGNAGCGKSMLLKHIFLNTIKQLVKIPIVIELRNLNSYEGNFYDYLDNLLVGKRLTPNKKILDRILVNGEFAFLLDGYDEIYSDNKNKLTSEIIEFIDNYSKNYFLITSRPGANVESLPRFNSYSVNGLEIMEVKDFIKLQLKTCGDELLAEKIIRVIGKPENLDYKSYLSNPLLLSMFIMTFNSYPEIPKSKNKFYWNVFDTLCSKHDSFTKHGGYQHERKSGLQNEELENILKWFSFITLFKGIYNFDDEYFTNLLKMIKIKLQVKCSISSLKHDLTVAISIIIIDGLEFKFPHKSLQEYFAALLIKEQDESIKKEIYANKLDTISIYSFGAEINLWNLCNEIDPTSFKKYFILRHLRSLVNNTYTPINILDYKSFINIGIHTFFIRKLEGIVNPQSSLQTEGSIANTVAEYVGIFQIDEGIFMRVHHILWNLIKDLEHFISAFDIIKIKINKEYTFLEMNKEYQDRTINIMSKDDEINNYINRIKRKLFEIEREIANSEMIKNELLGL